MQRCTFTFIWICILLFACKEENPSFLTPDEAISDFEIEDGFNVQCIVHEPDIQDPVAIAFDDEANMWVVEMNTYMPDANGIGEQRPLSKIKVISDSNGDNIYETVRVFADSLTLPRAVCPVYGGVLIAEPPILWFYDSTGKNRIVVDSFYADGGNVEHQPNGLIQGIDHWIYSAKSDKKYRFYNGNWEKASTVFRGQWGIDQDEEGKLFYNHNGAVLLGDQWSPSLLPFYANHFGNKINYLFGQTMVPNRVYPLKPTPGVNRGYEQGVLDSTGRLTNVTSACGISIYGGNNKYYGNAFSCEPAAQLVKRIILEESDESIVGKLPYTEKEFLRTGDEKFRPVFSTTGPDGALYIVDMYRGIIQHSTYLTGYLRNHITANGLDRFKGMGRIYRIQYENDKTKSIKISATSGTPLVDLLKNKNKWVRIRAQWKIVHENNESKYLPLLKDCFLKAQIDITRLHIIHILSQFQHPDKKLLVQAIKSKNSELRHQAMKILGKIDMPVLTRSYDAKNIKDEMVFVSTVFDMSKDQNLLEKIANKYARDSVFSAIIAGCLWQETHHEQLKSIRRKITKNTLLHQWLLSSPKQTNVEETKIAHLTTAQKEMYREGVHIYETYCAGCHGKNGEGIDQIAPPLAGSEWVTSSDRSIPITIVLDGISGPITVSGKKYTFTGGMTGLRDNQTINDGSIAKILTYIRNSWGNKATAITTEEVSKVRSSPAKKLPVSMQEH